MLGKNHTETHRIYVGIGVFIIGIVIVEGGSGIFIVRYVAMFLGGFVQAAGAVPLLERLNAIADGDYDKLEHGVEDIYHVEIKAPEEKHPVCNECGK